MGNFLPYFAEFLGTAILILLGGGVCANVLLKKTGGNNSGLIVIASGWAFAVFMAVLITGTVSGAHLNPAVTVAQVTMGNMEIGMAIGYIIAQILGAFIGAVIMWIFYKDHFDATSEAGVKKGVFCTAPSIRNLPLNFFSEFIATFVFILAALRLTPDNTTTATLGALPVTLAVWSIGMSLGGTTGYAINPARDLGPRLAHAILPIKNKDNNDWGYAWVPILGPIAGALLACAVYKLMF